LTVKSLNLCSLIFTEGFTVVRETMWEEGELTTKQTYQCAANSRGVAQEVKRRDAWHDVIAGMRDFIFQRVRDLLGNASMKRRVQVRVDHDVSISNIPLYLLIA